MQTIPRPTQREYETIWDLIHNYGSIRWMWDNLNLDYEEEGPVTVKTSDLWELKRAIIEDGGDGNTLPLLAGPFADAINTLLIDTPPWNWTRKIWKLAKENGGTLLSYAWPGGYPIMYVCGMDAVCPDCANTHEDFQPIEDWQVYFEGADEPCCICNAVIESAYGDPDAEEESESETDY